MAVVAVVGALLIIACVAIARFIIAHRRRSSSEKTIGRIFLSDELPFARTNYATLPDDRLLHSAHNFEFSFELAVKPGTSGIVFVYGEPDRDGDSNRPYVKLFIGLDGKLVALVHRTLGQFKIATSTSINDGATRHVRFQRSHTDGGDELGSERRRRAPANKWTLWIDEEVVAEHHDKLYMSEVIPPSGIYVGGAEFNNDRADDDDGRERWPFSGIEGIIGKVTFNGERITRWRLIDVATPNKTCCPCPKSVNDEERTTDSGGRRGGGGGDNNNNSKTTQSRSASPLRPDGRSTLSLGSRRPQTAPTGTSPRDPPGRSGEADPFDYGESVIVSAARRDKKG
jgi:hypothetical protein